MPSDKQKRILLSETVQFLKTFWRSFGYLKIDGF